MGRVKSVIAELDGGYNCVITTKSVSIDGGSSILLTVNDFEQCLAIMRYLRETRPLEISADSTSKLSGEYPTLDIPELPTLETPGVKKRS